MTGYEVIIPGKKYQIVEFIQDDLPGVAAINVAVKTFEPKIVFSWHLSIMFDLNEIVKNGMPSKVEQSVIDQYDEFLDDKIKGITKAKPNALFLARITWNKTRELIWRIYESELVNTFLQQVISEESSPRPFDYRMEQDNEWKLAEWHLKH